MLKPSSVLVLIATLGSVGCGDEAATGNASAGSGGTAGQAGAGGAALGGAGTGGAAAGTGGPAPATGGAGNQTGGAGSGTGGSLAGAGGNAGGASGAAGAGGVVGAGGSVNNVPADYKGTPFATLAIPGRINACDYDRGGAGVAFCHDAGGCKGATTGDYPGGSGVYRPAMPANAQICGGAACDDNVGVCRMNPSKPDNTISGQAMPATDTYLCYSIAGEWTKYTVHVAEAGAYSISGVMAVPPSGGGANLSFGNNITSGNLAFAVTPNTNSGSGENFHSWDDRKNLGTVTFAAAGTYIMTLTQVSRFNADSFTFTKM